MTAVADRQPVATRSPGTILRAFLSLTKPRIVELLLVTTLPTMMLAAGRFPGGLLVPATLVGGALAAGAANALNCYLDRDIDGLMHRTEGRPLPSQVVTPRAALTFGLVLSVVSSAILLWATTPLAAALSLGAIGWYVFVYTLWLKRRTRHSTVVGGVAGAAPVLIGWAAVTGDLAWPAWVLFGVVFLWQPPHFWALAMRFRDDYARADVPMLPVVSETVQVTRQIVLYTVVTVVVSMLLWPFGVGPVYPLLAGAAGAWFLWESLVLARRARAGDDLSPMRLFHVSISYLTLVFLGVALDVLLDRLS
ncbi:MAG: heme o synthase [Actinomycetota bacterium]|nr:heme o synthase [Actinomycetota bacterium]